MTVFHVTIRKGTSVSCEVKLQKASVGQAELGELKLGNPEPCLDDRAKSDITLAEMPCPSPRAECMFLLMVLQAMTQQCWVAWCFPALCWQMSPLQAGRQTLLQLVTLPVQRWPWTVLVIDGLGTERSPCSSSLVCQ